MEGNGSVLMYTLIHFLHSLSKVYENIKFSLLHYVKHAHDAKIPFQQSCSVCIAVNMIVINVCFQ